MKEEKKTPALKTAEEKMEKVAATTEKVMEKTEKAAARTGKAVEKAAEQTVKAVKTAVKKTAAAKKTSLKEQVYLQYLGKEINSDDIMKQVKEIWTKQLKKKAADLNSVTIYLKPEENAAYYVINEEETGKIAL